MRASDLLEHRPAYFYHGTSLTMALEALVEDRLSGPVSLTRDIDIAFKFARSKSEDVIEIATNVWPERFPYDDDLNVENYKVEIPTAYIESNYPCGGIVFVLDPVALRQNHAIRPYADDPMGDHKWEREERSRGDIHGFKRCVRKVIVGRKFEDFAHFVLNGWEGNTDPLPQYTEAIEFIRGHS